ncbi:zinc-ribbon domain containing protein [Thalassomonas actiniarum]|uniref:Zinc-ribbon domain containing protein n=1 Tax=Thalassomonas actiniarum TaxID=485447 RepID=A0AAF0C2D4_9GAMM|nr:zinc-ribbon domain containing protein [Thalassomonas actiniarum]WDD99951.1 zinc-ribbon domain containing protein [Thalassomonas actiniarum]
MNDNTYSSPPDYYYDEEYKCVDCGKNEIWTAEQQKFWYEELGKTINSFAVRCQVCRAHIQALKAQQKRHTEEMKNTPKHPNEKFFKNT